MKSDKGERKNKKSNLSLLLLILTIIGIITSSIIAIQLEAEPITYSNSITVFEERSIHLDLPPIVNEVIIYSLNNNKIDLIL